MKAPKRALKERKGLRAFLKKAWQCIWNSGGSVHDCPERGKSAQEIRDKTLEKCPWKGDLF